MNGVQNGSTENYKVLKNDKVGRYGVAARTLQAGETILSELPVAVGPKVDSVPLCLGCYAPVDCSVLCSVCKWPVCSADCQKAPAHADAECVVFKLAGVKFQVPPPIDIEDGVLCPQLECILPLRALVARDKDRKRWNAEVDPMESHDEDRKETPAWEVNQINTVNFLRVRCKQANKWSEELVHKVCGILEVNCFEIRCANGALIRGLYPQTAIMSHNCVANTAHYITTDDFRLVLRTTVRVEEGGELFTSYTHSLEPTMLRREALSRGKFFHCDCARCACALELRTHMSSLKCNKCDDGFVLSTNPLDAAAQWKCTHCEFCTRGDAVRRVLGIIQGDLEAVDARAPSAVEPREQLMRKYRSVLHPRHAFLTALRYSLCQLYGRAEGYTLAELPDLLLERKEQLCRDVLAVADVVEPGCSRLRGMILYELHAPVMMFNRNRFHYGEIDQKTLLAKMEEAAGYLEEAVAILKLEDAQSLEGTIAVAGEQSLAQLRTSIDAEKKK